MDFIRVILFFPFGLLINNRIHAHYCTSSIVVINFENEMTFENLFDIFVFLFSLAFH